MKKIIKMFSAVILLTLFTQNLFAGHSYAWKPAAGLSEFTCINPCQALAGADQSICSCCGSGCVTIGGSPYSSNPHTCGGANITYSWAPGGMTTEHPSVCPTITTIYTLYVTFPSQCSCDGTCSAIKTDDVKVTVGCTCSPCKIINPLFDPQVDNICFNTVPDFSVKYLDLNISPDTNGNSESSTCLIRNDVPLEIAHKPRAPIVG